MRIVFIVCCLLTALACRPAMGAERGLHMWEGRDGSVNIHDRRPDELTANPLGQHAPPRNTTILDADGHVLVEKNSSQETPHPLRLMQESQNELATSALSSNDTTADPEVEAFVQMMLQQNPEFKEQWERMDPQQQQAMLRNMQSLSNEMPMNIDMGMFTLLLQFMWVLQLLGVLAYILWALCMGRICEPLGVGSFAQFLIPFWNLYLLVKAADLSGWAVLVYLVPLVNLGFIFHIYGAIAARLGKSYVLYALGLCIGSMFMSLLIGLYPFFRLAQHARAMQQTPASQTNFGTVL